MVAISLDVTGARATAVGLRVTPSRLVSPARCCCGAFGLPPICLSRSPSSMSLEQLWGLGRLLSELTQLCVTAACDRYTRECLCFAKCTTRFSVCDEGHHLLSCFRGAGAHTRVLKKNPLGAATTVTPAWTEPLGAGTTVTPAWTGPWVTLDLARASRTRRQRQ